MSFYAVRFGRIPGIYTCWNDCKKQVSGFKGAIYKKFSNKEMAVEFYKSPSKTYVVKNITLKNQIDNKIKNKINKEPDTLYIFTDGSSVNNGARNAKSGYGIYIPEPSSMRIKISGKLPKGKTNNYAELKAILEALKLLDCTSLKVLKKNNRDKIVIVTDSQYSINCITQWYNNWIKKGWISSTGEEVKNKELIQDIHPLYMKYSVKFQHIKAIRVKRGSFMMEIGWLIN